MERAKRFGLATLMAFLALNVWTGSPLLALWIGSRVHGSDSQPSMGAYAAVIGCLALFSFALYQALKRVSHAYQEATGTLPTVRTHAPWLRSLRGDRPDPAGAGGARVTGAERIVVVTVLIAAVAFEAWFFLFSGSSIGGSSGR